MAKHYFENGLYEKAYNLYDKHIEKIIDQKFGIFLAEKYFFRAIISTLANDDYVNAKNKFSEYGNISVTFKKSRYGILLQKILISIDKNDIAEFILSINKYEELYHLSLSETTALTFSNKSEKV